MQYFDKEKIILELNKLNINDLVAYGADNAHVDYGISSVEFYKVVTLTNAVLRKTSSKFEIIIGSYGNICC